jgi:Uma2 family endonuclease
LPLRRFTVQEYHRMGEAGILTDADRVELLESWVAEKMIHRPTHGAVIELTEAALRRLLLSGWRVRVQSAITTEESEPEPDLVLVSGPLRQHLERHPRPPEIGLVVEVAETSLGRERAKVRLYARAGIAAYWIVNLVDSQVEMYSQP